MDQERASSKPWVLVATIIVIVGYAWLAARLSEPRLNLPNIIEGAVWYEGGQTRALRSLSLLGPSHFGEWSRIFSEAKRLSHELPALGAFRSKIDLVLRADDRQFYSVSDTRVELGIDVAASEGQLLKAIVKSWLFQQASASIQGSQLRMEVVSDVLVGMIRGRFRLGYPDGVARKLEFPAVGNWLHHAVSFAHSCGDPWSPLELGKFCGTSLAVNPLMLRPLLGAMIFEVFRDLPVRDRIAFVRGWTEELKTFERATPSRISLVDWREWLREELVSYLTQYPGLTERQIRNARLDRGAALSVDAIVKSDSARWKEESDLIRRGLLSIVSTIPGKYQLQPGGVPLTKLDLQSVRSPFLVWQACGEATVGDVLSEPVNTAGILYLPCYQSLPVRFAGLLKHGGDMFARENRTLSFLQLKRSALELAVARDVVPRELAVDQFLGPGRTLLSPQLGLDSAEWRGAIQAHKALGAIEAVEWFRSGHLHPKFVFQTP